ncbi:MAG: hypothetical protein FWE19_05685 [Oscillospiraceae bacterium]|nr:hypothetical protein [Oscillospiraceae bacterium]
MVGVLAALADADEAALEGVDAAALVDAGAVVWAGGDEAVSVDVGAEALVDAPVGAADARAASVAPPAGEVVLPGVWAVAQEVSVAPQEVVAVVREA